MESDIVEQLRDDAEINEMDSAKLPSEWKVLREAADEIDRLRAELAAAINERNGYLEGNRQTLRALAEANEIAARYKRQRDEARRWYCLLIAYQRQDRGEDFDPEAVAVEEGWDCFGEKEGGGA